ncbi:MAG: metal ABC transporter ATP-binding protein [Akkermansia sp.]
MIHQAEPAVRVENLTVAYDSKPVLWDVSLEIPSGQLMAIVGPNGAGKSTLIKALLGLMKSVSGTIRFADELGKAGRFKSRVGYVPQSGSVDWDFPVTVLDVVLMGCYGKLGWLRRTGRKERELARECIEMVSMTPYSDRQISQLSGGQQQRVFLARALAQQADLYFMDEPFKGVDAQTEKAIVALLKELKAQGKTVVVVHHDLQTVPEYFDAVCLLNIKTVATGPVAEVFTEANLSKTYRSSASALNSKGADE